MLNKQAKIPPPPGLIASIAAGFDVVARNILIICLPVALDLALWLGPRLSLKKFFQPVIDYLLANSSALALQGMPDPSLFQQVWMDMLDKFNLFIALRTIPVGITSLMSGKLPQVNPFGNPTLIEVDSLLPLAGWLVLLTLLGWFGGAAYFHWISGITIKNQERQPLLRAIGHTVLLSIIWLLLLGALGIPVFLMISFTALISPLLGQVILLVLALFSAWIILPLFFSPHGIFTYRHNALAAILNSLRLARFTLPTSTLFLIMLFVISLGLDTLWRTPPDESWLTLVGIAGHAFISTALLAASFVYYRDVTSWLQVVTEQMKSQQKSVRV